MQRLAMRPPRSLPAVLGLTVLLAVPASAPANRLGLQAKVVRVNVKAGRLRATVLATGDAAAALKGRTLVFDVRHAKIAAKDVNGDGTADRLDDVAVADIVAIDARIPAHRLPKVIHVRRLTDLTSLLAEGPPLPATPGMPGR